MNKNFLLILWMTFLSLLLLGLIYWAVFIIVDIKDKISILGIVALISAAFTSVLTVSINNKKAKEREYELHILKEKQKVFEHFYNSYFEMLFNVKKGKVGLSSKAEQEMLLFKKGLMNWGSERIIKKYLDFDNKLIERQSESDKFNILRVGDEFVKELRKELGYNDSNKINVMSIILNAEARKELKDKGVV
jgi:hypothetical protein